MTTKRPDLTVHSDETVLRIMRAPSWSDAIRLAVALGLSPGVVRGWYYRTSKRALRLASEHSLAPTGRTRRAARPRRPERDLIAAIMAGDA